MGSSEEITAMGEGGGGRREGGGGSVKKVMRFLNGASQIPAVPRPPS